ncbi:MAG: acyloxyacyl hydrolase [Gemmatimonadaceae bacterium]
MRLSVTRVFAWTSAYLLALGSSVRTATAQTSARDTLRVSPTSSTAGSRRDTAGTARWLVGGFVGVARNSPSRRFLGSTPGFDHLFLGLEALTPVLRLGRVQVSYGVQLLPLVRLTGQTEHTEVVYDSGIVALARRPTIRTRVVQEHVSAYAAGLSPFGLQIAVPLGSAVSVYGATAAGGLIFDRPFPIPQARRVNFTLEFGGGVLVRVGHERWVRVGYKYHHLSNAYTAPENPGLDGNVLYAGYDWSVRLPR